MAAATIGACGRETPSGAASATVGPSSDRANAVSTREASPPRVALIVEGRGMAGVELASVAPKDETGSRIVAGVLAGWGPVQGSGTCFEGTNCYWDVQGEHGVLVVLHAGNSRVRAISTDVSGWRTARGIGRGSTVDALKRTYRRRIVRRTVCGLNGFGGRSVGYVLNTRYRGERRFTFFELSASRRRVDRVWVGRGRASNDPGC